MKYSEIRIQIALDGLKTGKYSNFSEAARAEDVPRTTLRERHNGGVSHVLSAENQQNLSNEQENLLVQWIMDLDQAGHAPSFASVKAMTSVIRCGNSTDALPGKNWMTRFIKRHSSIKSKIGMKLERQRANSVTEEGILEWFHRLKTVIDKHSIKSDDMWNADEHGFALGIGSNGRVVGSSSSRTTVVKQPGNREWVTVLEGISAAGQRMKSLVIFKGKNLSSGWFPATSTPDWAYCSSPNAWTSNDIALKWLEQVFIPSTPTEGYRLLLLDGHKSHATHEFMWKCYTNKIVIFYLIPHSSHILQPLDLTCFSSVKAKYRAKIAELSRFDDASDVKKQTFIKLYSKASYESLDSARIKNGWMAAGIQPWNPVKAAQSRFVLKTPSSVQIQPPTPPNRKRRLSETELITTPCIPRQFRELFRSAQNGGSSTRTRRLLFQKAYKGIDKISFQLQLEKEKNDSKDIQLEQLKRKGHRGVIIDANQTFARLEQVHLAKEAESARDAAERARIAHFEANPPVASSVGSSLQDHCFEFSLDPSVR